VKLLDRYIGVHVVKSTLLVLAVLVALFSFIAFVEELDTIGRADYTLGLSLEYVALTTPRRIFELFPLAAVIGSLMGLGTLAAHSELTVMRASGMSVMRIGASVVGAGAILVALAMLVGEVLAPYCERLAHERRSVALTDRIALKTDYGLWVRDGRSFINIRNVFPGNRVGDVYIYEFDQSYRLRVSTHARSAYYRDGRWVLEDIRQSVIDEDGVTRRALQSAVWESLFNPELISVVAVRPEGLSAVGLRRYIGYLERNELNATRYQIAFWNKVIYPLATGVMVFLAIPLVLGRLRGTSLGVRILAGTLVGIAFHVLHEASRHMGVVYNLDPFLSVATPTLLFLGMSVGMMRRVR